jgi:hypothetical protein
MSAGVQIRAEQRRAVMQVFVEDAEPAVDRGVAFTPGGNRRDAHELPALVVEHTLLAEIDHNPWLALDPVPFPPVPGVSG